MDLNEKNETNEDEGKVNLLQYLQQRRAAVEKERAAGNGEEKAALQQYLQEALQQESQSEVDDQDDEENSTSDNESDEEHDSTDEDPTLSINCTSSPASSVRTATAATSVGATSTATPVYREVEEG